MNGSDHELDDLAPGVEPQEFHASHLTYTVGLGLEVLSRCGSRCRTGERKSKRILGLLCTIRRELIRVNPFNETSIPTPNAWVRFENVNRET